MYEALSLSPGIEHQTTTNEYVAEDRRPEGRSFFAAAQNGIKYSTSPTSGDTHPIDDEPVDLEGKDYKFATWRKEYFDRTWARGRVETARTETENEVL